MKFFIDTANLDQIREANELGVLDGVTTNPSLMAKEGIKGVENQRRHYIKICEMGGWGCECRSDCHRLRRHGSRKVRNWPD